MDGGSYDVGAYLTAPLYNSSYNIKDDPFLHTIQDDPYASQASLQVYLLEVLSAFAAILVLPAFISHIRNRNLPATCLVFWVLWLNVMNLVNALIWPNDDMASWYWGIGFCDIAIKMEIGAALGIIGAVICILRSLAQALNTDRVRLSVSRAETIRNRIIEGLYCIGLPLVGALLHLVVQSRRYYIYAISGCMYTVGETWVAVVVLWLWPPFFALIATYYAAFVLVRVIRYRIQFTQILSASSSGMSKNRFLRLFAISLVMVVVYLPVEIYVFVWNITLTPLGPYSWNDVHSSETWDYLLFFPAYGEVFFDRWIYASLGYALFLTLGLGSDATHFWHSVCHSLGWREKKADASPAPEGAVNSVAVETSPPSSRWRWLSSTSRLLSGSTSSKGSHSTTTSSQPSVLPTAEWHLSHSSLPCVAAAPELSMLAPIAEMPDTALTSKQPMVNASNVVAGTYDKHFAALEAGLGIGSDEVIEEEEKAGLGSEDDHAGEGKERLEEGDEEARSAAGLQGI